MKKLFVLAAVLLVSAGILFVGCKRKESSTAAPDAAETTSFTLLVDADRAYENGFYVLYDVIAKEIGVQIQVMNYPYQAAVEQKNILLNTGNYPDAMGGWIVVDNDIMTLSSDGTIIPLENYIANTTNIREALEQPGVRQ
ncbi:MAG: hypothetical protein LBF63_03225, partial [Treponema sp.]|nr:hypothetical protein [Treponema sp.]